MFLAATAVQHSFTLGTVAWVAVIALIVGILIGVHMAQPKYMR